MNEIGRRLNQGFVWDQIAGYRAAHLKYYLPNEDGSAELDDPPLLDRATELGCALYTQDDDLLTKARRRQTEDEMFAGVV